MSICENKTKMVVNVSNTSDTDRLFELQGLVKDEYSIDNTNEYSVDNTGEYKNNTDETNNTTNTTNSMNEEEYNEKY